MAWGRIAPLTLGLRAPVHVHASGHGLTVADSPALGDLGFMARIPLLGDHLGFTARGTIPTGDAAARLGAKSWTGGGQLDLAWGRRVVLGANLGVTMAQAEVLPDLDWGNRFDWRAGASLPLTDRIWTSAELDASHSLGGENGSHPVEWLLGTRFRAPSGFSITLGGGTALTAGIGAPAWRAFAGLRWAGGSADAPVSSETPSPSSTADVPARISITTEEGEAVQANLWFVEIGKRLGTDASGSAALTLPQGTHTLIIEAPRHFTLRKTIEATADTAVDLSLVLARARVWVVGDQINLEAPITFGASGLNLTPASQDLLDELAIVLLDHPTILRVEVQAHTETDLQTDEADRLSQARAETVVGWLVDGGVPAERLKARGYGERNPISEVGENARIEFMVLERAEPSP
jgi:outer membrane protein OmpA-like peptidoglycan-associated protein